MKIGDKLVTLGCLAVAIGSASCGHRITRMSLKAFTRYALYLAVMDDEIGRNELEGNLIRDTVLEFPPREESLQKRYHLFWERNQTKSPQQIQAEITNMEQRLEASRQYLSAPKEQLEIGLLEENDL